MLSKVPVFLVAFLLAACSLPAPRLATPTPVKPRAVYLVLSSGQLAAADLSQHPEVVVVHSFHDLQALATDTDVALWIDKDAAALADAAWLMQAPQKLNPLVVVGYNQALDAFPATLGHWHR